MSTLVSTESYTGHIGPFVRGEVKSCSAEIDKALASGALTLLADLELPATEFVAVMESLKLGAGEVECLLYARVSDFVVCCDDGRARTVLAGELGAARVTGSIGLLVKAVHDEMLSAGDAYASYIQMKRKGGFLPSLTSAEFEQLILDT